MSIDFMPKDLSFECHADSNHGHRYGLRRFIARDGIGALLRGIADGLSAWQERARMRRGLAAMDDRLLRDIGLTRADAMNEYRKPFWRA